MNCMKNLIYRSGQQRIAGFSWSASKIAMYKTFAQLCESGGTLEDLVALLPRNTKGLKPTGVMATVIQLLKWSEESGLTAAIGGFVRYKASKYHNKLVFRNQIH